MPAQPRKRATRPVKAAAPAAPTDQSTPVKAAAAEAIGENDVAIDFREQQFVVKDTARASARFALAVASGSQPQMIWELIAPEDHQRFLLAAKPGETFVDFAVDFFDAYGKASGQGNS